MAKIPEGMRRRENGGFEYRFTHMGVRCSVGGTSIEECRRKGREKEREIESGAYKSNDKITLNEYFKEWIEQKERAVKGSTIYAYRTTYKNGIADTLGSQKIRALERRAIVNLLNQIADNRGVGAANYARRVLASILNAAVRDEVITRNVAAGIPRIKDTKPPARETVHRELNERELRDFFTLIKGSRYLNAFKFMLYTGIRVGECVALQWGDMDFKNGLIRIQKTFTKDKNGKRKLGETPKTKKSKRVIPMNVAIRALLKEQMKIEREIHGAINLCGFVFPSERGDMAPPASFNASIACAIRKGRQMRPRIIIEPFSVHAFRDTFASRAIRAGIPPNTLKEILGHSSLAMTMDLYAHVNQQDKIEGMEKMLAFSC